MSSQNDIELVISEFSKIEQRLIHDLKATERKGENQTSFNEKIVQVGGLFSPATVQRLKRLAAIRNKFAHGHVTSLPNKEQFINECELINKAIDAAKEELAQTDYQTVSTGTYLPPPRKFYKNISYRDPDQRVLGPVIFIFVLAVLAVILHLSRCTNNKEKYASTLLNERKFLDATNTNRNLHQNESRIIKTIKKH